MNTFYFDGGLGDTLLNVYKSTAYEQYLASEKATVVIAGTNPYICELFKWTPNAHNTRIIDVSAYYERQLTEGAFNLRKCLDFAGVVGLAKSEPRTTPFVHEWTAPDAVDYVNPYIVIQPNSGTPERSLSCEQIGELVDFVHDASMKTVFATRDYLRIDGNGDIKHYTEIADGGEFERSVPAMLRLIQRSCGVIGMHSACIHAAAMMNIPTLALQNDEVLATRERCDAYFYYESLPHVYPCHIDAPIPPDFLTSCKLLSLSK